MASSSHVARINACKDIARVDYNLWCVRFSSIAYLFDGSNGCLSVVWQKLASSLELSGIVVRTQSSYTH